MLQASAHSVGTQVDEPQHLASGTALARAQDVNQIEVATPRRAESAIGSGKVLSRLHLIWRIYGRFISFVTVVLVPTLVGALYLTFLAAPLFVTEIRLAVQSPNSAQIEGISAMLGLGASSQSANDSHAVVQYLLSRAAVDDLQSTVNLRDKFHIRGYDFLASLPKGASEERFVAYWDDMISARFEATTNTIIVKFYAFTAQDSLDIAKSSLTLSEQLVNRMSERSRRDMVGFVEGEVITSQHRLDDVLIKLRDLRDRMHVLDPRAAAEANATLAAKIREDVSQTNIELSTLRRSLSESAPSVVSLRDHLNSLQKELDSINSQSTQQVGSVKQQSKEPADSTASNTPLSSIAAAFEQIENERTFAEKAYQASLAALEQARVDAARQQVYLETIVKPILPDEPVYPRPFRGTLIIFVLTLAAWTIGSLVLHGVREHI